jgi:hypothetical protein
MDWLINLPARARTQQPLHTHAPALSLEDAQNQGLTREEHECELAQISFTIGADCTH